MKQTTFAYKIALFVLAFFAFANQSYAYQPLLEKDNFWDDFFVPNHHSVTVPNKEILCCRGSQQKRGEIEIPFYG